MPGCARCRESRMPSPPRPPAHARLHRGSVRRSEHHRAVLRARVRAFVCACMQAHTRRDLRAGRVARRGRRGAARGARSSSLRTRSRRFSRSLRMARCRRRRGILQGRALLPAAPAGAPSASPRDPRALVWTLPVPVVSPTGVLGWPSWSVFRKLFYEWEINSFPERRLSNNSLLAGRGRL